MAIEFQRSFTHQDWVDNEDVVQAEGENGFNVRFHALEDDLDTLGESLAEVAERLDEGLGIAPIVVLSRVLGASQATEPEVIDAYSRDDFPAGVNKIYQVAIEPIGNFHGQVSHHFIYRQIANNQTEVSVWFRNELNTQTRITARIFTLNSASGGVNP